MAEGPWHCTVRPPPSSCSVDPYLFENFKTDDGDFLKAKFRAFKFPQSPFVLFKVREAIKRKKQINYGFFP